MKEVMTEMKLLRGELTRQGWGLRQPYPGTPSTEIMENIGREYKEIYAEWAPNEKVALEVTIGASLAVRDDRDDEACRVNIAAIP